MPALSVWAIRLALVQLAAAFAAGAWLLAARGTPALPLPTWLRPVHLELALLGWTLQLAMGVAYWILPRHATEPARGRTGPAVAALVVFNLGLATAVTGALASRDGLLAAGRTGELAGVLLFAANSWPRLKAFGT